MDQKIVGFNQFGAVIRKVKAWVESTFLTLSKDSADQSIAGVRSVSDIIKLAKGASSAAPLTKITYAELKALRDGAKLVPGMQYRIIDYTCTTTQTDTQSAGHVFDVIVTADDERTLNTKARAIHHEGDTYFTKSDLAKWQIWYDLDNAKTKYNWADETNGKGVIYRMIDEYGNDCPYDFKNIQFKRSLKNGESNWQYTFHYAKMDDLSNDVLETYDMFNGHLRLYNNSAGNNIIRSYIKNGTQHLNNILFFEYGIGDSSYAPSFITLGSNCNNVTLGSNCNNVTLGSNCNNVTLRDNCGSVTLRDNCGSVTLRDNCNSVTLRDNCKNCNFGNGCNSVTLRDNCNNVTLRDNCNNVTFGNSCNSVTLRDNCNNVTFGNSCNSVTFGNGCNYITFGSNCKNCNFGNGCNYITFGSNCENCNFGNGCNVINVDPTTPIINHARYIDIASGVSMIAIITTTPTNDSKHLQNISIRQGVSGSYDINQGTNFKEINIDVLEQNYEITYTNAANGTLVKQIAQA